MKCIKEIHLYHITGQKFAMMELKLLIAYFVDNFYLETVDYLAHQVPLVIDLVLRPGCPIHLKFVPIKK